MSDFPHAKQAFINGAGGGVIKINHNKIIPV